MNRFLVFLMLIQINALAQTDSIPNPPDFTGLPPLKTIIRVAPDDHVWVGFKNKGVGEFDGSNWKIYSDTNGLPTNNVTAITFNGAAKWIGTEKGLVKIDGTGINIYDTSNSLI